jgi:hypothetical protein
MIDTEATDIEARHPTTMLVGNEHDITLNGKTLNLQMPAQSALIAELN